MKKRLKNGVSRIASYLEIKYFVLFLVGGGTFFFGFFAGAMLNLYLLAIQSPFIHKFRASLDYKSAIFGDGIILPIVNMIIAGFLFDHKVYLHKNLLKLSLFIGFLVTVYFHVTQALGGIVNWAMPTPWHWNILGLWHAIYMFSVCSFISCFYLVVIQLMRNKQKLPKAFFGVTIGILAFFVLLHLDYVSINFGKIFLY